MPDVVQAEYEREQRERAARKEEPGMLIALYDYTPVSLYTYSYSHIAQ